MQHSRIPPLLLASLAVCALGPSARAQPVAPSIPGRYSAVSSAVMQYRWFKFPALGVLTVDAPRRHFALVGLSQLGINVFELSETNGTLKSRMPGPLLKRYPQIAKGAAADVRHMFFDLSPPTGSRQLPDTRGNTAIFQATTSLGTVEYRIDKKTGFLLEKRLLVPRKFLPGKSVAWRVLYEDYGAAGVRMYPRVIRFKQRACDYAITLFLKEMRINP